MSIRIVRLGDPRSAEEGLRIGTVRRPPRGVPKSDYTSRNFYDVWLPDLAPTSRAVIGLSCVTCLVNAARIVYEVRGKSHLPI